MADGPGNERLAGERPAGWPVSAFVVVALLAMLAAVLLLMNIIGVQIGGGYDTSTGGNLAEWFEALSTLIAVPLAVLVGVRQLQSTSEQVELGRQQLLSYEQERIDRMRAEHVRLVESVHLRTYVANVLDRPDLASASERADAERLRAEYRIRGWVALNSFGDNGDSNGQHGNGTWERDGERRTNAELLMLEQSSILPKPWFAAVECANRGDATVRLRRWTIVVDSTSTVVESDIDLRPGSRSHRRLGPDAGFKPAYARPGDVQARLGQLRVQVDATDGTDREFHLTAMQE